MEADILSTRIREAINVSFGKVSQMNGIHFIPNTFCVWGVREVAISTFCATGVVVEAAGR